MSEPAKTIIAVVATVAVLEVLKRTLGVGVSFTVAVAALAFCLGALWAAGEKTNPQDERGRE